MALVLSLLSAGSFGASCFHKEVFSMPLRTLQATVMFPHLSLSHVEEPFNSLVMLAVKTTS